MATVFAAVRRLVHLLVEANDKLALARGMQGFQISAAKHLNAAISMDALHHIVAMRAEVDLLGIGVPEQASNIGGQRGGHTPA